MIRIDFSSLDKLDLPGLNVSQGISRLGNDPVLYFELLAKFYKTYQDSPGILTGLETAGFDDEIASFVHTLKGDAGNIEAPSLFKVLKEYEAGIKGGRTAEGTGSSVVEKELALVIDSLGNIDFSSLPDSSDHESLSVEGRDDFIRLMKELAGFLDRHQPVESLNLIDRLLSSSLPSEVLKQLKRSRDLTDSYNFQSALTLVNELSEASGEFF